jgi:hypothetical protein
MATNTPNKFKSWGAQAFPNLRNSFKNISGSFNPSGFDWNAFGTEGGYAPYNYTPGKPSVAALPSGGTPNVAPPAAKGAGLQLFGKNVGKGFNIASTAMHAADALSGWSDYQKTQGANEDLMSKIRLSAMGNPLLSSYLTSEQLNLLGDVKSGRYDTSADSSDFIDGIQSNLGQAIPAALMGLVTGGVPGAIIGGAGTLVNAGIDNLTTASGQNTAELQALYQALQDAEAQYKSMKRPNFTGLGIQQQYRNMYA